MRIVSKKFFLLGLILLLAGAAVSLASVAAMSFRVRDYYQAAPPAQFEFRHLTARTLKPFQRDLSLNDAALPDGRSALDIRYGDRSLLLPVHPPLVRTADLSPERAAQQQ